jgi:hypothetical protein
MLLVSVKSETTTVFWPYKNNRENKKTGKVLELTSKRKTTWKRQVLGDTKNKGHGQQGTVKAGL